MKVFIKKHTIALIILCGLLFLLFFLYSVGFRITYVPSLENSWEAISAVSGWASALIATAALAVAIIVANRQDQIAKKQNEISERQVSLSQQQSNIALFEKRFEYYDVVLSCCNIGKLIVQAMDAPAAISLVVECFEEGNAREHFENDKNEMYIKTHSIDCFDYAFKMLREGVFLFDFETEKLMIPVVNELREIVFFSDDERKNKYHRFAFSQYAEKAEIELVPQIESVLRQIQQ